MKVWLLSLCLWPLGALAAEGLPDLIDLPSGFNMSPSPQKVEPSPTTSPKPEPEVTSLAPQKKPAPVELKVSESELQAQTLEALKKQILETSSFHPDQQLRLLSLVQEMQGHPDQAYLTFKRIKNQDQETWHAFRELYLSDILGLEEEAKTIGEILADKLFIKQLKVEKIAFCRSVKGFGRYDPFPGPITSNREVILYVEVQNLKQVPEMQQFQSSCKASFTIYDSQDRPVYQFSYPQVFNYLARSPLNDYFIWMKYTPSLPPGSYKMDLEIEDQRALSRAKGEFHFEIK